MAETLPIITAATYKNYPSERAWLEARCNGCGSSDAAAIVGYSRYHSPVSVWDSKVNRRIEEGDREVIQRVGHALEPLCTELFSEATGISVIDPGSYAIYTSKEWPWMFATIDRLTHDGQPVELKTAWYEAAAEWKERVPLAYQIQCQHQMAVTGGDMAYIAVILNGNGFKWHVVKRHSNWVEALVDRTGTFWREYVEPVRMPAVDGSDATRKVLQDLYPDHDETIVDLPPEWDKKARHWDRLQKHETKCKEVRAELGNQVRALIGEATYARCGDDSGWKWSNGRLTRKAEIKEVQYV